MEFAPEMLSDEPQAPRPNEGGVPEEPDGAGIASVELARGGEILKGLKGLAAGVVGQFENGAS